MLIENVDGKTPAYHMASGPAKALIAAGVAREVIPVVLAPVPNAVWNAVEGFKTSNYQYPPEVRVFCRTCTNSAQIESPKFQWTAKFCHCGVQEEVPKHVRQIYEALRKSWEKRYKRVVAPELRPVFDPNVRERILENAK